MKLISKLLVALLAWGTLPCPAVMVAPAQPSSMATVERMVMRGEADRAIATLRSHVRTNPRDGQAQLLLCRAYYSVELANQAVSACEAALVTLSEDSAAQDWMGRAYGIKADGAGPIAGYRLAGKVKAAFEKAVELDPHNADAVNDVGEYYVSAPAIVGGGTDKAFALADRVARTLPETAHRLRGLAAEKRSDYGTAEREFRDAVAGGQPKAWIDLGLYYVRRGQTPQAVNAVRRAAEVDTRRSPSVVDAASILLKMNVEVPLARRLLEEYLNSSAMSDGAPAFKALTLLGKALQLDGDRNGARLQYEKALELARDYAPAKKALGKLS
ncbi:MAG: hypothetical protein ABI142_11340 [Bryocella sp.]